MSKDDVRTPKKPLDSDETKSKLIELLQHPETNIKNLMVIQNEIIIVFNNKPINI
jgi:hypothetical protein